MIKILLVLNKYTNIVHTDVVNANFHSKIKFLARQAQQCVSIFIISV